MSKKTRDKTREAEAPKKLRRSRTQPWKWLYGTDRAYTRRRDAAGDRAIDRAQRSDEEQLALLDERLGKGVGAQKERARLEGR